jgi:hypothetical protein
MRGPGVWFQSLLGQMQTFFEASYPGLGMHNDE